MPLLLLRGADSDLLLPDVAHAMTQRGPRAQRIDFPDCGHAPALSIAPQINAVRQFLAQPDHAAATARALETTMMKRVLLAAMAGLCTIGRHGQDFVVAHVYDKTGPLEAYAKQTQNGLMLGLEYATQGTMTVAGRKIRVIERTTRASPTWRARSWPRPMPTTTPTSPSAPSSGVALAMLPIAEEYERSCWSNPPWRIRSPATSGTSTSSAPAAIPRRTPSPTPWPSTRKARRSPCWRRTMPSAATAAFKGALKHAKIVHEEYLPANATDFTAGAQRCSTRSRTSRAARSSSSSGPARATRSRSPTWTRSATASRSPPAALAAMTPLKSLAGMEGATYYYYGIPKNPVNDWLVAEHQKRFGQPPDFFTAGGMSAGIAIVQALNKTQGKSDTDALIKAMEGMSFGTPKGKMTFRPQDHQAMQSMYHFRIKNDASVPGPCGTWCARSRPTRWTCPSRTSASASPLMLETQALTIRFGGHVAVDSVRCGFAPGTLTAIVGPNGAGKTTYFNLISGQLRASWLGAAERPRPDRTVRAGPHACGPGPGFQRRSCSRA